MYKKHSPRHNMTWSEAVDEALCFGWIDSVMHRIDDERHAQRFSPRKPGSNWSAVNVAKIERLRADGPDAPRRRGGVRRSGAPTAPAIYSFEQAQRRGALAGAAGAARRRRAAAAAFFDAQPPGYRRTAIHWVTSAKKPETRERRLAHADRDSAAGRRGSRHLSRP